MTDGRNDSVNSGDAGRDPRLDRLYRDVAREEPPAHLDAAILAAAHREAGARPRSLSARLRAWRVPVSIAAVVMLSVSLVTLVREEGGDDLMQPSQSDALSRQQSSAPAYRAPRPEAAPAPEAKKAPAAEHLPPPVAREDRVRGSASMESARKQAEAPVRQQATEPQAPPAAAARPDPQPFASMGALERRGPAAAPDATTGADSVARSGSRAAAAEEPAPPAPRPAPRAEAQLRDAAPAGEAAGALSGAIRPPAAAAPAEKPSQARQKVESRAALKERPAADTAYLAGVRCIVSVDVDRIADSCGYAVPRMDLVGDRDRLVQWSESKGADGLVEYRRTTNAHSIDGLPGIDP